MQLSMHECFNGERKRLVNEFSSKAKAVNWAREWYVPVKGHYLELVNEEDGSLVGFDMEDKRTIKPMGWGFKPDYAYMRGKEAKNLTHYVPNVHIRRV